MSSTKQFHINQRPDHDALDQYDVEEFYDPFQSPEPNSDRSPAKKRTAADGLGIEEEVAVAKRARIQNVKLDEAK
jgi:replication fork protection complex subunit Csm3/Swi3